MSCEKLRRRASRAATALKKRAANCEVLRVFKLNEIGELSLFQEYSVFSNIATSISTRSDLKSEIRSKM